jgi:hypothetical protein
MRPLPHPGSFAQSAHPVIWRPRTCFAHVPAALLSASAESLKQDMARAFVLHPHTDFAFSPAAAFSLRLNQVHKLAAQNARPRLTPQAPAARQEEPE